MTTTAGNLPKLPKTERPRIELSCREARMLLKTISPETDQSCLNDEQYAAIVHYLPCKECVNIGLSTLTDQQIDCKKALELYASFKFSPWHGIGAAKSLEDLLAIEHIFGRDLETEGSYTGLAGRNKPIHPCSNKICVEVRDSHFSIQTRHSALPFLIELFQKNGFDVTKLLTLHKGILKGGWPCGKACDGGQVDRDCGISCHVFAQNVGWAVRQLTKHFKAQGAL